MNKTPLTTINGITIYKRTITSLPYNAALRDRARRLRKQGIFTEVIFWKQVHKGLFHNIDFDRQRIIGNYIVDFYVKHLGLIIEIDGASHNDKMKYDEKRERYLKSLGLYIHRIPDKRVKYDLGNVMPELESLLIELFS